MATIKELQVTYQERETNDLAVGQPIRDVDAILRLMSFLRFAADENVYAIILDSEFKLIGISQISRGGRHETILDPASLFRVVLLAEGAGVILVHNHPSGGVRPSPEDVRTTERIILAGFALAVPLIDHVIIGAKDAYSFGRAGMLAWLQAKQLKALGIKGVLDVRNPEEAEAEARAAIATLARKEAPCAATPATEAAEGRMPVQMEQEADDDE
jgi:proteasome lid subunit RPN8/RPN11